MIVMNPCVHDSRVIKEAESLTQAGYHVRVVCLMKVDLLQNEIIYGVEYYRVNYHVLKIRLGKKDQSQHNIKNGQNEIVMELGLFKKTIRGAKGFIKNIIKYFIKKAAPYLKYHLTYFTVKDAIIDYKPDAIHAHDLITLPAAVTIAKKLNIPVIYDSHELETDRMPKRGIILQKLSYLIEKQYINHARAVITVSNSIGDYLANKYQISRPYIIYNSPDYLLNYKALSNVRSDFGLDQNDPLMIYVGAAQKGRGIEELLKVMCHLKEFYLALVGPKNPTYYPIYEKMIVKLDLCDRVRFFPPVAPKDVISYISSADIGICTIQDTCLSYRYCMPNKLFELAFAGLPIVCSNLPDMSEFVTKNNLGAVINAPGVDATVESVRKVYAKKNNFKQSYEGFNQLIHDYGWKAQADKLLKLYSEIGAP